MRKSAVNVRNSKGFNITELIVVMGIIAVMVAIGAPAVVSQITHLRLTRSVRDVVTELNAARFKAIAKNKRYQVEFTLNSGATPPDSYQLQSWSAGSYVDEPGRAAGLLGEGISITNPTANFTTEFYPNGSVTRSTSPSSQEMSHWQKPRVTDGLAFFIIWPPQDLRPIFR